MEHDLLIRPATAADIPILAELWAAAFPGERSVEQRIRQLEAGGVYGGVETAWIAKRDAATVGGFRTYALQQHVHGAVMPMMGLAAVAVDAGARRGGIGAELCRFAVRHAYERGDVLSALYPFRPSFYEALGWGIVGALHTYRFSPASVPISHTAASAALKPMPRVRRITADVASALAPCYDRAAARSNGLIARTTRIWQQHLDWPDVYAIGLFREMHPRECSAYALVHARAGERTLTVREMIADDEAAYVEMLHWISLQRDAYDLIVYDAQPSERFDLRLVEPRTPGRPVARTLYADVATVIRGPMLRIVNVSEAMRRRARWNVEHFVFLLDVKDDIVSDNNGVFEVTVESSSTAAGVTRMESMRTGSAAPTLKCGIRVLTQIYLGEITPSEAVRLGLAVVSGTIACLDDAFRVDSLFVLLDEF